MSDDNDDKGSALPWRDVELEIAQYRSSLEKIQCLDERERLIHDMSISDEEFLAALYRFQGSAATFRDYEERVSLRAMLAWGALHAVDPTLIKVHYHQELRYLRVSIQEGLFGKAASSDAVRALEMIKEERANMLSHCGKCNRLTRITMQWSFNLLWRRAWWCDSCCHDWATKPSTPPIGGIRSALARARAAHLPATLTEEQWQLTVGHFDDRCAFCGGPWSVIEHATSIAVGGGTTSANCIPACQSCNSTKRDIGLQGLDGQWDEVRLAKIWAWLESCGRPPRDKRHRRRGRP